MSKADDAYIVVGRIGATYGIRGWLKIQSFTEFSASILDYNSFYLSNETLNDTMQPTFLELEEGKLHGKGLIAKFKGFDSPEEARSLTGKLLSVKRSQLPQLKKNEFYWADLKGLSVINQRGETLGKVIYLLETGANDVLVVQGQQGEQAIPYLPGKVILEINLEKQEIHVDWEII